MRRCLLFVFLLGLSHLSYAAQDTTSAAWKPYAKPSLDVHRLTAPIVIDGSLDDAGWRDAAHVTDFTECLPDPGKAPHAQTEAWIAYDDQYLYIAMLAHDKDPSQIRATLRDRDEIFNEDFMGIILDTYGDANRAYELYANPLGVQGDLLWTNTNEDATFDMIYQTEAKITSQGWQMEMKIPFTSLRFPNRTVQDWHMTFWRNHPRLTTYKYSWAPISFFVPCTFCQLGQLTGIENVQASGGLDLLPTIVAHQTSEQPSAGAPLVHGQIGVTPSLGLKYYPGPNATIEAAINPDFSQVESDATQVSANTTFALFYPEHRPFFQEGSDLFQTYLPDVYTRSINDPLAVAKAIYRDGPNNIGYLGGYDRNSPVIIPLEEQSIVLSKGRSVSNIVRAVRDLDNGDFIGGIITDRRYEASGSNSTFGFDGHYTLGNGIEVFGQGLGSVTQEPNDRSIGSKLTFDGGQHTVEYNGEKFFGDAATLAVQRFTRGLDVHIEYGETSPTFRSGNGFVFSNDTRTLNAWTGYKQPIHSDILLELDGGVAAAKYWNFDGAVKQSAIRPFIDFTLGGQTGLHVYYRTWNERFHEFDFSGLNKFDVNFSTRFSPYFQFGADISTGRDLYRAVDTPSVGNTLTATVWVDIKPFSNLLIQPTLDYSRLDSLSGGGSYYNIAIYRVRSSYQFTRQLSLRLIGEYANFDRILKVDPLLTYKVSPFTVFYIGSTHNFYVDPITQVYQPSERQFFAKVQYLIEGLG